MYHLCKQTRTYEGEPYCGPTSYNKPAEFKFLADAIAATKTFIIRNPVGWNVYNSVTKELSYGYDFTNQLVKGE